MPDYVEQMFTALPPSGDNAVGRATRSALVSRLAGATPGAHTRPWPQSSGPAFVSIFFPHHTPAAYTDGVSAATGLAESFWSGFAVAVLCQAMYNITSQLRRQLMEAQIQSAVTNCNNALRGLETAMYGYVLQRGFPAFTQAYNAVADKRAALKTYMDTLQSDPWITAKSVLYHQPGGWPNADWELYHHWVKLTLLGASDSVIATVITTVQSKLAQQHVTFPANVAATVWRTYNAWMNLTTPGQRDLSWEDIAPQAQGGILAEVCIAYPGSRGPSCMREENSYEFTANGQPGSPYRHVPSSSCLAAGTKVLMANGTTKPIETVKAGEAVTTLYGPRQVALVAAPLRSGRALQTINGLPFRFTSTHPFYHATLGTTPAQPRYASLAPFRLGDLVPTLAGQGIAPMAAGTTLAVYQHGTSVPYPVHTVAESPSGAADPEERLYDLILAPRANEEPHYVAGCDEALFVVATEIPRLHDIPETAACFLALLEGMQAPLTALLARLPASDFLAGVETFAVVLANTFLPLVMQQVTALAAAPPLRAALESSVPSAAALPDLLQTLFTVLAPAAPAPALHAAALPQALPSSYNAPLGVFIEHVLALMGDKLHALLSLGWRQFPTASAERTASILALTLMDLRLAGDAPLPTSSEVMVTVQCAGEAQRVPEADGQTSAPFVRVFEQVVYFDRGSVPTLPPFLELSFVAPASPTPLSWHAVAHLPQQLAHGWASYDTIVRDRAGVERGRCAFDLRWLTPAEVAAERAAQARWTPAEAAAFRQHFVHQAAALLPQLAPDLVEACLARQRAA